MTEKCSFSSVGGGALIERAALVIWPQDVTEL